ncbi:MAG: glycosyltransferase [Planctomycetes bacterium]|nr:glycosyltransferase [Planctomycetota bacterium]
MLHVATATDRAYWPHLPTLLNSIVAHTSGSVTVHVLVRDIPEAIEWARRNYNDALCINVIDTSGFMDGVHLYLGHHITRATMDRLLLPDLLPSLDRVIYLDLDTLVLDDLNDLYPRDTGPEGLLARPSEHPGFSTVGRALQSWRHDNFDRILPLIDPDWPGFNAGVMLMDLACLRERAFVEQTTRWVRDFGVNDQIACALYAQGKFARLEPEWNVFIGMGHERIEDWRILHWAGQKKPWSSDARFHDQWKQYERGLVSTPAMMRTPILRHSRLQRFPRPRHTGTATTVRPPISLVTACMNRHDHLRQTLPTWLNKGFDEIVLLDWSSTPPLRDIVDEHQDGTIVYVELVESQRHFHQAKSKNLKMRLARHALICMIDCDVQILADDFLAQHPMAERMFYAQGGQNLGGSGLFWRADWDCFGGCNENMVGWGHEDSDMHHRMEDAGWRWNKLSTDTVRHIDHDNDDRTRNFAVEHRDRSQTLKANKMLAQESSRWDQENFLVRIHHPGQPPEERMV